MPIQEEGKIQMKTLVIFAKTTLIGGILIVLPIYVSVLLLAKAVKGLLAILSPITAGIPAPPGFREILAALVLAGVCFAVGLIARSGPGLRAKNAFEQAVLARLPGYTLLRGLAARLTGQADGPTFAPALVEIEEALVPALIMNVRSGHTARPSLHERWRGRTGCSTG
jgi:uncharacterized membrane protein